MIEFPLILIGYALLPLIAIQLMIMADRPQKTGKQTAFPQVESRGACGGSATHEQNRRFSRHVPHPCRLPRHAFQPL